MFTTPVRRLALPIAAVLALGVSAVAPAAWAEETATECVAAGNVWVHVEHDEVVTGACATEFATGTEAMVTTGLATDQGAFYTTVDGVTSEDPQWWSLWTASVEDGELGEWEFAQVGIQEMEPEAGQVLGWRLLADYNQPQEPPLYNPLTGESASAAPEASAPVSADPSAEASASAEATAPAGDTASASPSEEAPAAETDAEAEADSGIPMGTLVGVGAVIALAAVGGLVWWRRRGQ